ncbi:MULTISPECIES: S10 family peptidase [unclassified Pseudonocardia]|uniref:S10 family peptidase n=1 Tax=unclassified Pseudonocardia TaxID=2619320 RepID=UPI0007619545|nr:MULTISPECIES: hypothetical protein [unclassified Pseudonocardia]
MTRADVDHDTPAAATTTGTTHEPPAGASSTGTWNGMEYRATAQWLVLRKDDKPTAEMFSVAYLAGSGEPRPVTFVFNGGPGASSAYLHLGAVGPRRVDFPGDGSMPPSPPRLVDNDESWLAFTDLVFIDPVGTGFSRMIEKNGTEKQEQDADAYFGTERDLQSLCEFIRRWLSEHRRWSSPVFVAGESYGGYRAGRLTRMLGESAGIGLAGAVLISPALEFAGIGAGVFGGDYEVLPWVDVLPTMALAAHHHGRSRAFGPDVSVDEVRRAAEQFATGDYAVFLTRGASGEAGERERVIGRLADLLGLPPEFVARAEGRVRVHQFARELLREQGRVVGRFDATVTTSDPFPDRDVFTGGDPTLTGAAPVYTTAVNHLLRSEIGLATDREYLLLNTDVVQKWKDDGASLYLQPLQGATDDFRYGMALNPRLRAFITHGVHDLQTPYYAADRLHNLMRLDPATAERLTVRHFDGGHMFYAWTRSRQDFTSAIADFVAESTASHRPAAS